MQLSHAANADLLWQTDSSHTEENPTTAFAIAGYECHVYPEYNNIPPPRRDASLLARAKCQPGQTDGVKRWADWTTLDATEEAGKETRGARRLFSCVCV